MTMSTPGTLPATSVTTIDDWRPLLDLHRTPRRQRIEMPLELRLILVTTTVVLALVAAGAQLTSVLRNQSTPGSQQALTAVSAALFGRWRPDGVCYATATVPRMISAQELASPHTPGVRQTQPDVYAPCRINGLAIPEPPAGAPTSVGQVILVSLSQQWLWAYQDGALVFANPVATGMPGLRTPQGTFHIQYTLTDTYLYSPWPRSSPFYSPPEHISFALHFRAGGFYIHDEPQRQMFGPGAQDPHTTPDDGSENGSHGSITTTKSAAAQLYQWARVGAAVIVVA